MTTAGTSSITVEQFDQMVADGAFEPEQRIELIHGELREIPQRTPPHEYVVDLLTEWSFRATPQQDVRIRNQNSVGLAELNSVSIPDMAWVRQGNYFSRRPQPEDVFLIIEVSDSTLRYDLTTKSDLYASAGLADYWVVDVNVRCVYVHRNPGPTAYGDKQTCDTTQTVSPLAFPDVVLPVAELFTDAE